MSALDFTEIPAANAGTQRDQMELFAREYLEWRGFRVVSGPDRGADAGRDLVVEEIRRGPAGETRLRWLVSCKHKAHSGTSVTAQDENNINDRLVAHGCNGFIGFYTTLVSSGLSPLLEGLRSSGKEVLILDAERVERELLADDRGRVLAARFMPVSTSTWLAHQVHQSAPVGATNVIDAVLSGQFFNRIPHGALGPALAEASQRQIPVFLVVYDSSHSLLSRIAYTLGYFMDYETTRLLVSNHFVPAVCASSDPDLGALVPSDDPLETCRWLVLNSDASVIRSETLYANPDEGLRRVREVIAGL